MCNISVAILCFTFSMVRSEKSRITDTKETYVPDWINLEKERHSPQEKQSGESINVADENISIPPVWKTMQPLKGDENLRWRRQLIKNYQPFTKIDDAATFAIVKRKRKERHEIGRGFRHGENWRSYEKRVGNERWRAYSPSGEKHVICGNRNCSVMPTIGDGYCFYRGIVNSLKYEGYTGKGSGGERVVPEFYQLLTANLARTVASVEVLRHWVERTYTDADWNIDKYIYDTDVAILPHVLARWLQRVVGARARMYHHVAGLRLTDKTYLYLFALHYYYEYNMWMSMAARSMRRRVPVPGLGLFRVITWAHPDQYAGQRKLCLYFKLPNHYEGVDCRPRSMNYVDDEGALAATGTSLRVHYLEM